MTRIITKGTCELCGTVLGKKAMENHLEKCLATNSSGENELFDLLVQGEGMPFFWLYVEANVEAKLLDLDQFLRGIWLECCGHLSAFRVGGTNYFVPGAGLGGKSMKNTLDSALRPGDEFSHEYDFGDTTYLQLKVLNRRVGAIVPDKVRLLARNEPPPLTCGQCGKPATQIYQDCDGDMESPLLCDECATDYDEDYRLPVVNSPRCGVCGYTGED